MGAVLLGCAHRHDQRRPLQEPLADHPRSHFLQTPGAPFLMHRGQSWLVVVLATGVAAAEWLRHPAPIWVGITWACVAAVVLTLWPLTRWRRRLIALLVLLL